MFECQICYEKTSNLKTLPRCKHAFCSDCINEWSQTSDKCPMCRQKFVINPVPLDRDLRCLLRLINV